MPTPAPATDAPARSALREATRAVHQRLESSLRLAAPDLTRSEYLQILQRFSATYSRLESQLDQHAPLLRSVELEWQERCKLPLLQRDLAALGQAEMPATQFTLRRELPRLETLPELIGCLYVLEGATLGGKLICANLRRVLGIGPDNGAAFFASYGEAVAGQWQRFCVALEKSLSDVAARQEAALSAVATFELFNACIVVPESERSDAISPAGANPGP
jgi:heme oxygenase (biliverdin-IX-beta and delta-forming)